MHPAGNTENKLEMEFVSKPLEQLILNIEIWFKKSLGLRSGLQGGWLLAVLKIKEGFLWRGQKR